METTDPTPGPQCLASQEDDGVETNINPVTDHEQMTHGNSLVTSQERPQDNTKVLPLAPAVITRYYSVLDDEGVDDVFIPSAPPPASYYMAAFLPAGGGTGATESNSSVTLVNGAADATEAKANPDGLDWHHGQKQLMVAQNEVEEVITGTAQTSKESMDTVSLSNDSIQPTDQTSMEGTVSLTDPPGRNHQDNTTGEEESNGEAEDIVNVSERQENWGESDVELDRNPIQIPSTIEENSENETHFVTDGHQRGKKELVESQEDSEDKPITEIVDCDGVETNPSTTEVAKCNQNSTGTATNQAQVPETPTEVTSDDEEHIDTRSLNFNLTKCDWLKRERSISEIQVPQLPISEEMSKEHVTEILSSEMERQEQQEDESWKISTEIQQGEELLQRLQLVQQRQDVNIPENPSTSQQDVPERSGEEKGELGTEVDEAKSRMSSSTMPAQPEDQPEADKDHSETSSTKIPFLQRTGSLADDPDVLEIPFRTNISLEPLSTNVSLGLHSDWRFSEQKMQETSQETKRELVNQGKMPGGFSKGEFSHLQETKLLFEAFQLDNTEGPKRYKKPPSSLTEGHIFPTVLERTRSLEMFAHKSCPVSRTHSLRLYKSATPEREKSPENLRSRSPNGGPRDKTRLSPYPKQDKHLRLHRSMDSISTDATSVETKHLTREGNVTEKSSMLRQNPFFKLRPALALQPEVEKDIREAREREEELRRQRCTLYGENRQDSEDEGRSSFTPTRRPGSKQQSTGKLERVWPPPSKKDQIKSEQTQQEPKVHRAGGQKTPLWQRWESGMINSKPAKGE